MLRASLGSSLLIFDSGTRFPFYSPDLESSSTIVVSTAATFTHGLSPSDKRGNRRTRYLTSTKWKLHSTAKTGSIVLSDEERKTWDACRQAFSGFEFTNEEEDKMLGKAFGFVHSPFWGEDREKKVPNFEDVSAILNYLRGLSLSDDDLAKLLKKFPEVLGCSLEDELKVNVGILDKDWAIKGKSLRNLLLRNPKVLGYNVDCKGDCMAQCTRCWVRF